ncbi:Tim44 domain-containing protein [Caenimonas sedimenti]|uniref:Tim44 domain-containing protein n=1 Tax=Caenimonas sedimenti TaxID=2596921 RepID=A0A562ZJG9_9BURK|nr:TIM44-like domain-containing protein [Caenimonas sedimenti]TWO68465.1 Tim44 domain-containing protein [Caenimonas sedimenti]
MKKALGIFAVVLALGMTAALDAEAKRLGGARNSGMQRQQTTQPATPPAATPNTPGAATPAAGTAAAAAAPAAAAAATKRSWMGPLAGLAAGIGLMALASHLGFGEAMANMMLIGLLVMVGLAVVAFIMRKRAAAGMSPAMAGSGMQRSSLGGSPLGGTPLGGGTRIGSALGGAAAMPQAGAIPADFDVAAFSRNAKTQFMALQAANDARDLDRLRDYLTPEMFEVIGEEVRARGDEKQNTEVFGLEAQVTGVFEEADQYIVSVRFTGSVREQHGAVPEDLDEIWHLTKPRTGFGGWVVAGIQQAQA